MDTQSPLPCFAARNLSVLSYANGFTLWHYRANGPAEPAQRIDIALQPGFFGPAADMISFGDVIIVSCTDGVLLLDVRGVVRDARSVQTSVLSGLLCSGSASQSTASAAFLPSTSLHLETTMGDDEEEKRRQELYRAGDLLAAKLALADAVMEIERTWTFEYAMIWPPSVESAIARMREAEGKG